MFGKIIKLLPSYDSQNIYCQVKPLYIYMESS